MFYSSLQLYALISSICLKRKVELIGEIHEIKKRRRNDNIQIKSSVRRNRDWNFD